MADASADQYSAGEQGLLAKKDAFLATIQAKAAQLAATGVWPTSRRLLDGIRLGARYAEFHSELNQILLEVRKRIESNEQNFARD